MMLTLSLDVRSCLRHVRWGKRLRPVTGLPDEMRALRLACVPGIAGCALEVMNEVGHAHSRWIAYEDVHVVSGISACQDGSAENATPMAKEVGEPDIRGWRQQLLTRACRPNDVHDQQVG